MTETITGFPPDALLMTSTYDHVYDEDLPGFLCIKTQFWDKGQPDVEVYLRRRTIEGEWVWLVSKAVSYVNEPIPGIIIMEKVVKDEDLALRFNRLTRVTAILVQAVEAAGLSKSEVAVAAETEKEETIPSEQMSTLTDNEAIYKSLMNTAAASGIDLAENREALQNLLQIAASGGSGTELRGDNTAETKLENEFIKNVAEGQKKAFDPFSIMESVRKGVRLDLGLTRLQIDEVKLITLVLSGKLPVDQVAPVVLGAVRSGMGLKATLRSFSLDSEKSSPKHLQTQGNSAPPVTVLNFSYTYIGNTGTEMLSEILYSHSSLRTLDLSFCKVEEKGFLALAKALAKRKRDGIPALWGLILSGNYISARAAENIGKSLSPAGQRGGARGATKRRRPTYPAGRGGYEESSGSDEEEEEEEEFGEDRGRKHPRGGNPNMKEKGLQVLHVANASMTSEAVRRLLNGLGAESPLRELNLSSNLFGPKGAEVLVQFLEDKSKSRNTVALPQLDRLDMSNNNLGDDGTTQLTRVITKRTKIHLVDLRLSQNSVGPAGVETIMNKLLQHNLVSLSLDKNAIGDQGCKLVAASLITMKSLSRLNLSFNQIGSRGINSLMRSLVGCESVTYLGLSGNILKISGAIALAFTLGQHPRLEEIDLDNCCLGQAAQCHISAGIISNRWIPMKRLRGYAVGPPMVAIGALKPFAQNLSNEECFRIRKDEQMKTMLQWMESNRIAKKEGSAPDPRYAAAVAENAQSPQFLTPDFVSEINDVHGTPSQNSYFRLLGWLSRIPFDDDELTALQKYFFDADGGEGDRGSDGYINLKLRGDLLAALDSEVADEIRDELPSLLPSLKGSVGMDLDKTVEQWNAWEAIKGNIADKPNVVKEEEEEDSGDEKMQIISEQMSETDHNCANRLTEDDRAFTNGDGMNHSESTSSNLGKERQPSKVKPRITMFPQFEQQLEELKATATAMIEEEEDPMQHEVILSQYAEASLTILRQLRYHCMNSGLDGWLMGGMKRKVLVVDDSRVTRKLVSRAFERANFIVDTAANGAEGVEKLKASIYDIAFMDIDMPVMNGFEATKKLREWEDSMRPGTRQPICALTATYVDDFERSELMKFKDAGLDVMESKPCNIPRLFKVVDDVSPMFSDLSISIEQRVRSETKLSDHST